MGGGAGHGPPLLPLTPPQDNTPRKEAEERGEGRGGRRGTGPSPPLPHPGSTVDAKTYPRGLAPISFEAREFDGGCRTGDG